MDAPGRVRSIGGRWPWPYWPKSWDNAFSHPQVQPLVNLKRLQLAINRSIPPMYEELKVPNKLYQLFEGPDKPKLLNFVTLELKEVEVSVVSAHWQESPNGEDCDWDEEEMAEYADMLKQRLLNRAL